MILGLSKCRRCDNKATAKERGYPPLHDMLATNLEPPPLSGGFSFILLFSQQCPREIPHGHRTTEYT